MTGKVNIDVESASLDELKKVQGMIMARLSRDVHARVDNASPYDSHGSNHTNHSGKVVLRGNELR